MSLSKCIFYRILSYACLYGIVRGAIVNEEGTAPQSIMAGVLGREARNRLAGSRRTRAI